MSSTFSPQSAQTSGAANPGSGNANNTVQEATTNPQSAPMFAFNLRRSKENMDRAQRSFQVYAKLQQGRAIPASSTRGAISEQLYAVLHRLEELVDQHKQSESSSSSLADSKGATHKATVESIIKHMLSDVPGGPAFANAVTDPPGTPRGSPLADFFEQTAPSGPGSQPGLRTSDFAEAVAEHQLLERIAHWHQVLDSMPNTESSRWSSRGSKINSKLDEVRRSDWPSQQDPAFQWDEGLEDVARGKRENPRG